MRSKLIYTFTVQRVNWKRDITFKTHYQQLDITEGIGAIKFTENNICKYKEGP